MKQLGKFLNGQYSQHANLSVLLGNYYLREVDLERFEKKFGKMSQEELATASGINLSSIKKYETGLRNPKIEQLNKLAAALNISPNELLSYRMDDDSDILSIILKLQESCGLTIEGDKDSTGNYIPGSMRLCFKDNSINNLLAQYMTRKSIQRNSTKDELQISYTDTINDIPIDIEYTKFNN